jgi:hypothetical protein
MTTTPAGRRLVLATTTVLASFALVLSGTSPATAGSRHQDTHPRPARTVALPDGFRPEGIASGPRTTYYAGSMENGSIVTGDLRRRTSRVLLQGQAERQIRGMQRDPRTGLLWATGNVGSVSHVWAVSTRTGLVVQDYTVPDAQFLNDLTVTRRAVWVTDSRVDRLTRIALSRRGVPTSATPTFLPLTGRWPGGGTDTRANGIRRLSRGHLVLDHSSAGGLWDVNTRTGDVRPIRVTGVTLTGGDGVERRGRTLWVVRGTDRASVTQLRLQRRHGSWTASFRARLTDPTLDVPSTATFAGGLLWAVNARFGVASPETASYWITPLRPRRR